MLKNAYFLEKDVKNCNFIKFFFSTKCRVISLNEEHSLLLPIFAPIFNFNSVVFVDRGRKNISCPRAQDTLATPLSSLGGVSGW